MLLIEFFVIQSIFFSETKSAAFKKKSNFVISIVTSLLEQIN